MFSCLGDVMGLERLSETPDISNVVDVIPPKAKPRDARLPLVRAFNLKSLSDGVKHILGCYEMKLTRESCDGEIYNLYSLILSDYHSQNKQIPKSFTYSNVHAHYKSIPQI
jgi:hypothetical protein